MVASHVDDDDEGLHLEALPLRGRPGSASGTTPSTRSPGPGVVLWGADDPYVTPEFGERLAQRTGARLVMFPDSGHWWPVTKPAEVAAGLESLWIRRPFCTNSCGVVGTRADICQQCWQESGFGGGFRNCWRVRVCRRVKPVAADERLVHVGSTEAGARAGRRLPGLARRRRRRSRRGARRRRARAAAAPGPRSRRVGRAVLVVALARPRAWCSRRATSNDNGARRRVTPRRTARSRTIDDGRARGDVLVGARHDDRVRAASTSASP